jgi:hypothetical protein
MSDPVAQFDKLHADVEVLFLVCMQIALSLVAGALEMLTNYIYRTVTAEAASLLPAMRTASGYTGETIVDPDNFLAKELKRRGLLDVAISDKNAYPNGMAQPAVLVLRRDGTVLYQWAIVPGFVSIFKPRPPLNPGMRI